jgi:hypothetical protein
LTEEQTRLLYESKQSLDPRIEAFRSEGIGFPVQGWSKRNIVSSRVAWSRLRLARKHGSSASTSANPAVAGGLLGLAQIPGKKPVTIENSSNHNNTETDVEWYNEEKAEADMTLAVLSEGAEIYLRTVVTKAIHCARQRQNLDGICLWHQQLVNDESNSHLLLLLGCDVVRQVAQAEGNAAMTCRRLEASNKRQSHIPEKGHWMNDTTLTCAKSMSDLSLCPKLDKAEMIAELEGKRKFEIYGGKLYNEPPLGRWMKFSRLEVSDVQTGMQTLSRRRGRMCHPTTTSTSSFFH